MLRDKSTPILLLLGKFLYIIFLRSRSRVSYANQPNRNKELVIEDPFDGIPSEYNEYTVGRDAEGSTLINQLQVHHNQEKTKAIKKRKVVKVLSPREKVKVTDKLDIDALRQGLKKTKKVKKGVEVGRRESCEFVPPEDDEESSREEEDWGLGEFVDI